MSFRMPHLFHTASSQPAVDACLQVDHAETRELSLKYVRYFGLESEPLQLTVDRREFEGWLGRRVSSAIGGAYTQRTRPTQHLVLINLSRIDLSKPKSLEIVVAEEFLHMRNWLDGDRRRHAKHGHDRIAYWVAELTGSSIEDVRTCLLPRQSRPARYLYRCPGCQRTIERRRRGTWSCGRCAPAFDPRFVFQLERDLGKPAR